ncbi:unnamed protein product [Sphagnum troendelagicum]|uniref:PH domain-containing protein n=1 Tax=Sphagnum troendelagicum TaxID=128251 RepID=A0ABP0T8P0_9BRYO
MAERREVDEWVQEFEDAMKLAEEIMARIHQERSSYSASTGSTGSATDDHASTNSSSDTDSNLQQMIVSSSLHTAVQQRKLSHQVSMPSSTSSCRRKLSQLAHKLEHLESLLQQPNLKATISEKEMYRRQDMLLGIRFRTKKMAYTMGSFKSHSRKNLSTQSAAGAASTAAIPTVVNLKQTSMQGDLNSSTNDQGSSDDAAGAKVHLVAGSLVPSSEKDLDSNQLPIVGDELMSLNHIAIKVTDELEEELHAPLLVNLVQDTGFKNISVQDKKRVIVATKSNWCCILMWIFFLVFVTTVLATISLFVLRSQSKHP